MAIEITVQLAASPNPTTLPRRVRFMQTLRSDLASERVVMRYVVDGEATGIRFVDADGQPVTTIDRVETVASTPTALEDRIKMVGSPAGSFEDVQITQLITDSDGEKISDDTILVVQR